MHPSPDLLALLALGETAGTPAERDHVASCDQCRSEVADLARAVAAGRSAAGENSGLIRPPDRVWGAIRAELELDPADGSTPAGPDHPPADAKEPSSQVTASATGSRQGLGRRVLALALAAVLALVVGIGLGLGLNRLLTPRQTVLWTAQLQALPAHSGSSGEALVEQDSDGNKTLVVKLSSPAPVDGAQEVWLIDRGVSKMQSLGHLTPSSNRFNIPADLDPRQYPVVDISQEPPDGKPTHSGDSIVRGTLNV
jgi:anti-sigma-K factor RskA